MRIHALSIALLAACPLAMAADDNGGKDTDAGGNWSGAGEIGFAAARGNAKSENLNAKLNFQREDEFWKDSFYLTALRNKGEVQTSRVGPPDANGNPTLVTDNAYETTANRYETGASVGYKLDERSYIVGALRYEHDDFSPFQYQAIASIGYGYTVLKTQSDEFSFEIGPGYKRLKPIDVYGPDVDAGNRPVRHTFASEGNVVGRGLVAYKHAFTDSTSFVNTLLVESGSDNTFLENDAGLQVDMNKKFALKIGYQVRRNSDVAPGTKQTDQLMTTNLVYSFGGK